MLANLGVEGADGVAAALANLQMNQGGDWTSQTEDPAVRLGGTNCSPRVSNRGANAGLPGAMVFPLLLAECPMSNRLYPLNTPLTPLNTPLLPR